MSTVDVLGKMNICNDLRVFHKGQIVLAPKWQILWDVPGMHKLVSIESGPRMTTGKTETGSWVPTVY